MFLKENNIIYHDIAIRKFLVGQIVKKEMLILFGGAKIRAIVPNIHSPLEPNVAPPLNGII